jgi:hypothetical protein
MNWPCVNRDFFTSEEPFDLTKVNFLGLWIFRRIRVINVTYPPPATVRSDKAQGAIRFADQELGSL